MGSSEVRLCPGLSPHRRPSPGYSPRQNRRAGARQVRAAVWRLSRLVRARGALARWRALWRELHARAVAPADVDFRWDGRLGEVWAETSVVAERQDHDRRHAASHRSQAGQRRHISTCNRVSERYRADRQIDAAGPGSGARVNVNSAEPRYRAVMVVVAD